LVGTAALTSTLTARAQDLKAKSDEAIQNFKMADLGLTNFFTKSAGYVILPKVGEGAFIIGGEHGDGLVYEKDKVTGKVTMSGVTIGAQVGGGSFAEVIFLRNAGDTQEFQGNQMGDERQGQSQRRRFGSGPKRQIRSGRGGVHLAHKRRDGGGRDRRAKVRV